MDRYRCVDRCMDRYVERSVDRYADRYGDGCTDTIGKRYVDIIGVLVSKVSDGCVRRLVCEC